jgi:MFS family permease
MGLGLSTLFPLSLRAAGDDPERAGPALAAVSTVGYTGFLAGPPAIGLLAEATDLRAALAPICLLLLLAASLAGHLRVSERASRP